MVGIGETTMAKVPRKINHRNKPIPHKGITTITKEMDLQIAVEVREEISMDTDVDMENWTSQQASQAIKILKGGNTQ